MKDIAKLSVFLDKFTDKVIKNVAKAQQDTAKEIWQDVVNNAPVDTGNYIASIKVGDTIKEGNTIKTEIYTNASVSTLNGKTYNLGYLLENGTSPHLILPVNAKMLHFVINGEDVFTKKVNHPGTIAQPHFKPALDKNINTYLNNIAKAVKEAEK